MVVLVVDVFWLSETVNHLNVVRKLEFIINTFIEWNWSIWIIITNAKHEARLSTEKPEIEYKPPQKHIALSFKCHIHCVSCIKWFRIGLNKHTHTHLHTLTHTQTNRKQRKIDKANDKLFIKQSSNFKWMAISMKNESMKFQLDGIYFWMKRRQGIDVI